MDAFEKYNIDRKWLENLRIRCGNRPHEETLKRVMEKLDSIPTNSKPFNELDENGNVIKTFTSLKAAAEEYGINYQTVYTAMREGRPIRGHIFVRAEKKKKK